MKQERGGGGGGNREPSGRAKGPSAWCEKKIQGRENSLQDAWGRRGGAVAMRGVWILLEHMKWKKGTDGGGAGGRKKIKRVDRCSRILRFKGESAFCTAVVEEKKKSKPMSVP